MQLAPQARAGLLAPRAGLAGAAPRAVRRALAAVRSTWVPDYSIPQTPGARKQKGPYPTDSSGGSKPQPRRKWW